MEATVKESLASLLAGIEKADKKAILEGMEQVDRLLAEGRGSLHPQLVHFLERRSYAKALAFLGGEGDIPRGTCAPKR